jgi:hypothetical protein
MSSNQDSITEKGMDKLVAHVENLAKKRGKFSRRRAHDDDQDVYETNSTPFLILGPISMRGICTLTKRLQGPMIPLPRISRRALREGLHFSKSIIIIVA